MLLLETEEVRLHRYVVLVVVVDSSVWTTEVRNALLLVGWLVGW